MIRLAVVSSFTFPPEVFAFGASAVVVTVTPGTRLFRGSDLERVSVDVGVPCCDCSIYVAVGDVVKECSLAATAVDAVRRSAVAERHVSDGMPARTIAHVSAGVVDEASVAP